MHTYIYVHIIHTHIRTHAHTHTCTRSAQMGRLAPVGVHVPTKKNKKPEPTANKKALSVL
jgi:hypothetical protein